MDAAALRPDNIPRPSPVAQPTNLTPTNIRLVKEERPSSSDLALRWDSLNAQGTSDFLSARFAAAQEAFEAAVELAREFPPNDPRVATSLNNLGETYRVLGRLVEAQPLLEEALAKRELVLEPRHPHVARSRNNLGFLCELRAQYFEA